jgi:hypothetical protein
LVQAFLEKWWVESDFKAPNLPLSLKQNFDFKLQGKNIEVVKPFQLTYS